MRQRTYTLHVSADSLRGDPGALDRAQVVPDGFCWGAFVFNVLWFLRHRLWLASLFVAVLLVALALLGRAMGLPSSANVAISLLASALIGLEASSLRRWTYGRRGMPARDAVQAGSLEEAESKLAARWLEAGTAISLVRRSPARETAPAIGLFPWNEGAR